MLVLSSYADLDMHRRLAVPRFERGSRLGGIQRRGQLRVGIVSDMPGFSQYDPITGDLHGLDIEIAKLIAQAIFGGARQDAAQSIDFVDIHISDRERTLEEDAADLVVAVFAITPERCKRIDFTTPYFGTSLGILVHNEYPIDDRSRLAKARIGVPAGSVGAHFAVEQELSKHIVEYVAVQDIVKDVHSGKLDACVTSAPVLDNFARSSPDRLVRPNWSFRHLPHGVGVKKDDEELRSFVNAQLTELWNDGALLRTMSHLSSRAPVLP